MTPRRAELAANLFTGAVIASVAVALAGLSWRLTTGASPASDATAPLAAAPARPPVDAAPIIALAPFGRPSVAAQPTSLPLALRGILLAAPRSASTALIAPSGGGTSIAYRVGQAVPGGATVEAIAIDHVILAIGGRRELLALPKPSGGTRTAAATAAATTAPTPPPPSASPPPPPSSRPPLESPGYRVGEDLPPALRQAGLQPGDVIERVNGTLLSNAARDRELLVAAALAGSARIDLLRDGKRITLSLSLR
ncbi:signaling protein [Sphingomonas oleivorans]|uniref:Signaling protein n=1 Tax=Sphingomonas oleivorans TaxID=1735121 RepID=A0A2T5FVP1_9SPHN|nr:type II secretion system protein N [Sphingomonas oleivorans]PTQ09848.1 signaling protein [Sphingomonas oleivorans]